MDSLHGWILFMIEFLVWLKGKVQNLAE